MGSGRENDQVFSGVCCLKTCSQGVCLAFLWKMSPFLSWGLHMFIHNLWREQMAQEEAKITLPEASQFQVLLFGDVLSLWQEIQIQLFTAFLLSSSWELGVQSRKTQDGVTVIPPSDSFLPLCFRVKLPQTGFRFFLWLTPNATFCHKGKKVV